MGPYPYRNDGAATGCSFGGQYPPPIAPSGPSGLAFAGPAIFFTTAHTCTFFATEISESLPNLV
jgi:hypothetical protein